MKTSGLTLREAVESGRPFRFKTDSHWIGPGSKKWGVSIEAALLSDWEIQPPPPKQTWTREEVKKIQNELLMDFLGEYSNQKIATVFAEHGL